MVNFNRFWLIKSSFLVHSIKHYTEKISKIIIKIFFKVSIAKYFSVGVCKNFVSTHKAAKPKTSVTMFDQVWSQHYANLIYVKFFIDNKNKSFHHSSWQRLMALNWTADNFLWCTTILKALKSKFCSKKKLSFFLLLQKT